MAGRPGADWWGPLCDDGGPAVKMVATDLDGTLLRPDGSVSDRTARAVRAARQAGVHVVPVTGRPPHVTWDIIEQAGLGPLGVCSNGAALVDAGSGEVVESVTIGAEVAVAVVYEMRDLMPDAIFAFEGMGFFIHEAGFIDTELALGWSEPLEEVDDIAKAVRPGCTKVIVRRPGSSARELLAQLQAGAAEKGHITSSGLDWVEIGAPGISKAYALERACRRLGVAVAEVLAIGDNHNDLTVLAWAGRAAAPANAIPEVLAAVQHVVPANSEDGVAQLLERLVLSRCP